MEQVLTPLYSRLLVRVEEERETKSGIIITGGPDKRDTVRGEVLAVGPGYINEDGSKRETMVRPGDRIVFQRFTGDKVKVGDEKLLIVDESYVLAIEQSS